MSAQLAWPTVPDRRKAIDALFASVQHRLNTGPSKFAVLLGDWDVFPISDRGTIVGALVRHDNELHLGVRYKPNCLNAHRQLRAALADTVRRYGYARTQVAKDNPAGLAFCRRLGFEPFDEDATTWYLRCDTPRHRAKGAP